MVGLEEMGEALSLTVGKNQYAVRLVTKGQNDELTLVTEHEGT